MDKRKQTNKNFIFNIINLIVNVVIAIFFIPYLVKSLGIVVYGIIPLALIVNQYIRVITVSLTNSLTRFYSISIEKNKTLEASKYLSTSFIAITFLVIALSPFFIWFVSNISSVFNIPIQFISQTKTLFTFTLLSFVLSLYSSLINITLFAKNRLDSLNIIKILRISVKVVLTVSFFEAISNQISYIGYANFLSELIVLVVSIFYFRKTVDKEVKISFKLFEKAALISMLSMMIWVVVHQIGDTGLYRTDNILVNKFWSTKESGALGAVSEFGNYVMMVISVISSLFAPLILIAYANGDHESVKKLATRNSLMVGVLASLLVGLLVGFSKSILNLWLGPEFIIYSNWFILKIIVIPFYVAAGVFAFVYRAWNRIFVPAMLTLLLGLINLTVCYFILYNADGREIFITYMLIVTVVFILLQSYGLNAYWFTKLYPEEKMSVFYGIVKISIALMITSFLSLLYNKLFTTETFLEFFIGSVTVIGVTIPLLFLLLFKVIERKIIYEYVLLNVKKMLKH
ncbi:MAG: hypothetical protein P8J34_05100 [Flavobacteriales bacterium]|nr:hypothetical protein [Flavobacteriales bacterium]